MLLEKTDTFTLELDFVEVDKHSEVKKNYEEENLDFGSITYRTALKLVRNGSSTIRFGDLVDYVGIARSDNTLYPFSKGRYNNYDLKRVPTRYYVGEDNNFD